MELKEYQKQTNRTRNLNCINELGNYALGMVCEAGEVGDILKKHMYHNHELDIVELEKEIGDTMWYISNICNILKINLEEVLQTNINKLMVRYPEGFNQTDSIDRIV